MTNKKEIINFAFIDSQNLNLSIRSLRWKLNFSRFRTYLREKYKVKTAYIFIGFLPENQDLYNSLQKYGYVLIFKPTLKCKDGKVKGNCDAELVLRAMIDYENYNKAIIVTGDGDFHCLIRYLAQQDKLEKVLIPNKYSYSALLKKAAANKLAFINDLKKKLELRHKNKKHPVRTKP
ncbi:MAG TPA: NYN domain-containing protein [Candidatus Moranbacteria bacterium]|nr:NYN domain-containing protein [Candidatus Moranbacteria bacterium]